MRALRPLAIGGIAAATGAVVAAVLTLHRANGLTAVDLGDCEAVRAGLVAQPVAAWTALTLVLAGTWIAWDGDEHDAVGATFLGLGAAAAGIASFAAHATAAETAARWDAGAVAALLGIIGLRALTAPWWAHVALAVAAAGAVVVVPETLTPAGAAAAVMAVAALLSTRRSAGRRPRTLAVAAAPGAVGAVLWALGRTGGPLCDPSAVLQPHGAWHVLGAVAVAAVHVHLRLPTRHTPGAGLRSA